MFDRAFLKRLRLAELEAIVPLLPPGGRVLEIGAGQGEQARALEERGFRVTAIDMATSTYAGERVFDVTDYDGRNIPLADASVEAVFSSNVLEHVEDLPALLDEMRRVTVPGGIGVHAMPTPGWRFWTFAAGPPTSVVALLRLLRGADLRRHLKIMAGALLPVGHGTSREGVSELWTFGETAWKRRFAEHGFDVVETHPIGLFHTGHMLLGRHLSMARRRSLARRLGSAARIYVIRPVSDSRQSRGSGAGRRPSRPT